MSSSSPDFRSKFSLSLSKKTGIPLSVVSFAVIYYYKILQDYLTDKFQRYTTLGPKTLSLTTKSISKISESMVSFFSDPNNVIQLMSCYYTVYRTEEFSTEKINRQIAHYVSTQMSEYGNDVSNILSNYISQEKNTYRNILSFFDDLKESDIDTAMREIKNLNEKFTTNQLKIEDNEKMKQIEGPVLVEEKNKYHDSRQFGTRSDTDSTSFVKLQEIKENDNWVGELNRLLEQGATYTCKGLLKYGYWKTIVPQSCLELAKIKPGLEGVMQLCPEQFKKISNVFVKGFTNLQKDVYDMLEEVKTTDIKNYEYTKGSLLFHSELFLFFLGMCVLIYVIFVFIKNYGTRKCKKNN
jgi:hypothetical protein